MIRRLFRIGAPAMVLALAVSFAGAQDTVVTKKEVTVHPDGSYTVIEYPVGKEVTVNLLPAPTVTGGKGIARVVRSADGTKVYVDVSGVPATTTSYYAYAVDPSGAPTLLGPITFTGGVGKAEFTTPLNQFMVVLSPTEGLTAVNPTTTVFTSEVPTGYAVVPRSVSEKRTMQVAKGVGPATAKYNVPMLNVGSFPDDERELKLKFGGDMKGLEAKAYVDREDGMTKVRMEFDDMKKVPANKRFTLWATGADGSYTKLGQVVNSGRKDEAVIRSQTTLDDFGLFITVEDADVMVPTSTIYSVFTVPTT